MAKSITIGDLPPFPTLKSAESFFREIRDRYIGGGRVSDYDARLLNNLLVGHPEKDEKLSGGVAFFTVGKLPPYGTPCFIIHREDGSTTDFSYPSCIHGARPRADRNSALRAEIHDQIKEFRRKTFLLSAVRCPITNTVLSMDSCHIDHAAPFPFATLVQAWLEQEAISFDEIAITPPADNQTVARMTDNRQIDSWRSFHQTKSILRAVAPIANLSYLRKKSRV